MPDDRRHIPHTPVTTCVNGQRDSRCAHCGQPWPCETTRQETLALGRDLDW